MRVDKYLKVSRILKRRTVANELASNERVFINGKVAKPSSEVKVDDILDIHFGNRILTIKVLDNQEKKKKEEAAGMYEVISEKRIQEEIL